MKARVTASSIWMPPILRQYSSKHAMLVACIKSHAERMRLPPDLPTQTSRRILASTLISFATKWLCEISHPSVIATFRLAIAEATRSPEIAQASAARLGRRGLHRLGGG
jgi:hypothetical protein